MRDGHKLKTIVQDTKQQLLSRKVEQPKAHRTGDTVALHPGRENGGRRDTG